MTQVRSQAACALYLMLLLGACSKQAPPAPPPPEVNVVVAEPGAVANVAEVTGRVQAIRTAQVRARVDGIVQKRLYTEGSDVKEGQPLFEIDPRPLRAALNAAEAALTHAEASAANAEQDVQRYQGLIKDHVISQQQYDTAVATSRTAQADVAQARAQVETAKLNLSYSTVTAPIPGRAGRAEVTEGALVSATQATLLTTIEQLDPIYVNFSQSSSDLLSLRRDIASGKLQLPQLTKVTVNLILEDGTRYAQTGHMNFLDLSVDENTGTVAMRAQFPNPDRTLLPGEFVRGQIAAGVRPNGFVVPQRAVKLTPQGASVMIVDNKNIATPREVKLGALREGSWLVADGLQAGDRVIVDGLQKVQPGAPVQIAENKNASGTAAGAGPAAR